MAGDTPLERAQSQLSIGTLDGLLQALWSKLATVGTSPLLQDESSPRLAFRVHSHRLASRLEASRWLTVDPGSTMAPGEPRVLQDDYYKTSGRHDRSGASGITLG